MRKILFWMMMAMMSVYGAEVISGSFPFPFFRAWGWEVLMPLYGLHLIVLATLVFKWGRPDFRTLYLAGMLLGLYEAYITKILWLPRWFGALSVAHLGVAEVLILVFWWHPFMSFIFPLMAGERLLTTDRRITVPKTWQPLLIIGGLLELFLIGSLANTPAVMLRSVLLSLVPIAGLVLLWRWTGWHHRTTIQMMMPEKGSFALLTVALGTLYLILGRIISPEHLPPLGQQVGIWIFYAIVLVFFVRALRRSKALPF
jgi:hypothetical protein